MEKRPAGSESQTLVLGILQVFIGLGAVAGGGGMVIDPSGSSLEMPLEMLRDSPFSDFLIPGIVLLTVNGFCSLGGAFLTFRRHRLTGLAAIGLGLFLVAWIVIQVYWVGGIHWLHVLFFGLGVVELFLGVLLIRTGRKAEVDPGA